MTLYNLTDAKQNVDILKIKNCEINRVSFSQLITWTDEQKVRENVTARLFWIGASLELCGLVLDLLMGLKDP